MTVVTLRIELRTDGHGDVRDVTGEAERVVRESGLADGTLTLFVPGSTAGLTTIEFEPGATADFQRLFDELAAPDREYRHHLTWGDDNGHSHVRAALLGPGITVPFTEGRLTLGTWQQIVLVDFDTRPRDRSLVAQIQGE
jgi:secondary thiamine-phosphate synthase enzyme